jgi:hypothetical protein
LGPLLLAAGGRRRGRGQRELLAIQDADQFKGLGNCGKTWRSGTTGCSWCLAVIVTLTGQRCWYHKSSQGSPARYQ